MRLVSATVRRVGGSLPSPVGAAARPVATREGALLRLRDELGNEGLGEASPLPGFSPESLDDAYADLTAALPVLLAEGLPERLDALAIELRSPVARFALESAWVDLVGRRRGLPARAVLGGDAPVAVNGHAGAACATTLLRDVRALLDAGFGAVKVKVGGGSFAAERAALARLRGELGDTFSLRLDANGAWGPEEARANVASLAPLDVEFIEQPVAGAEILRLGELEIPWAADESLLDPAVRARLLADPDARRGCAAFVVKPALLGGLRAARELALAAIQRRVGVVVTHLFDGPVALAACRALARSLPMPPLACGLDLHPGLDAWPPSGLSRGPWVMGDDAPGLGVPLP